MIIKTAEEKENNKGKSKKQEKKKRTTGSLRKDYTDMSPCRAQTFESSINKMTYGFINSHNLKYIISAEGRIDFKESWIEFILYMTYTIIKFYPDKYADILRKGNVTGSGINIDKTYGTIRLDGKAQCRVFKIYDTGLYMESRFEPAEIFNAVAGLIKIYSGDYTSVLLGIEDKKVQGTLIDTEMLDSSEEEKTLDNVFEAVDSGYVITEVEIHNEKIKLRELDGILYVFCKWVYDNFSDGGIKKLPKNKYVGVVSDINREDVDYNSLNGTSYFIYTNHDNRDIINFIRKSVDVLKLDKTTIKFKVHKYRKDVD